MERCKRHVRADCNKLFDIRKVKFAFKRAFRIPNKLFDKTLLIVERTSTDTGGQAHCAEP